MVSWATDGGGVGAHVDSYDVFLLQAQGRRRWRIARHYDATLDERAPLKVLRHFVAEQEFVLEPGDLLYLPPHWAHEGTAVGGDCMTCSIGMRAPQRGSLAAELDAALGRSLRRSAAVPRRAPTCHGHTGRDTARARGIRRRSCPAARGAAERRGSSARRGAQRTEAAGLVRETSDAMAKPRRCARPPHADALRPAAPVHQRRVRRRPAAQTPPCCAVSPTTARSMRARCAARAEPSRRCSPSGSRRVGCARTSSARPESVRDSYCHQPCVASTTMAAPPGVTERDFSSALEELANAVGREWVFTSDEDMNLYRDAYSPFKGEAEDRVPSAAVAPDTVEQVQAIVRIANRYRLPLWTIATGRNLGYGGSAPAYSGSVVVDLKRMNRILEVNDKTHYAVVEPGVSYFDLYRYIQERKLNVWIDPADPGWGSPRRQRARARRRPHADARPLERRLRPRGRARERRGAAHGHGRAAELRGLAPIQVRLRAARRRPVLAIELRHRDAHGPLADARARGAIATAASTSRSTTTSCRSWRRTRIS